MNTYAYVIIIIIALAILVGAIVGIIYLAVFRKDKGGENKDEENKKPQGKYSFNFLDNVGGTFKCKAPLKTKIIDAYYSAIDDLCVKACPKVDITNDLQNWVDGFGEQPYPPRKKELRGTWQGKTICPTIPVSPPPSQICPQGFSIRGSYNCEEEE